MGKRKGKILLALAAFVTMTLVAGNGLYAIPPHLLLIDSPQRFATAFRFGSDADDFMSVRFWNSVEFERWFGVVSFYENRNIPAQWANFGATQIYQFGFATRIGGVYVGLYGGGNAWRGFGETASSVLSYTIQTVPFFGDSRSMRVYDGRPELGIMSRTPMYNEFAVLIGVGDMGFRLSYTTTFISFRHDEDFAVYQGGNLSFYRSIEQEFGHINPEFAWGMTRDLLPDRGIRPEVRLIFDIYRDNIKREPYNNITGQTNGVEVIRSQHHFNLGLQANLGDFTLREINEFRWRVNLQYRANLFFYNNEYSFRDSDGNFQIGRLNGHFRNAGIPDERSRHMHWLQPSTSVSWSGDRIRLASALAVNITADFERIAVLGFRTNEAHLGTLVNHGAYSNSRLFLIRPLVEMGMQWAVVPDRFFLNTGAVVDIGRLRLQTIEHRMYSQGEVVHVPVPSRTETNNTFEQAETELRIGFTFNPTRNIELQALSGIGSDNSINVFDTGASGLLRFFHVLATVRF